jgi:H/ACA ribonucleoprotein complex subunit 1
MRSWCDFFLTSSHLLPCSTHTQVPYFNGPIFLENKTQVGKVEEIFGPINASMFTIKMAEGIVATSYAKGDKFHISPDKLLPMERFLPQKGGGGGGGRGGGRGGRGGR